MLTRCHTTGGKTRFIQRYVGQQARVADEFIGVGGRENGLPTAFMGHHRVSVGLHYHDEVQQAAVGIEWDYRQLAVVESLDTLAQGPRG